MTSNSAIDLDDINQRITDRTNCFYWQTDRAVDPGETGQIFADRHASLTDEDLLAAAK